MIQRIQTLFMTLVVVATGIVALKPLMLYTDGSLEYELFAIALQNSSGENVYIIWPLLLLCCIAFLISLTAIFLYKKRMLQIRLNVFAAVLQIGFYGLLYYMHSQIKADLGMEFLKARLPIILPVINAILCYLAIRSIGKDEALVRSLNRIR